MVRKRWATQRKVLALRTRLKGRGGSVTPEYLEYIAIKQNGASG